VFVATGRESSSAPEIVVWLANCGTGDVGRAGLIRRRVRGGCSLSRAPGLPRSRLGARGVTRMVGSIAPPA